MMTLITGCQQPDTDESNQEGSDADEVNRETREPIPPTAGDHMKVQYLEIVTPEVDALCVQYRTVHGISFSEPDANLGGARTAKLNSGGLLGIRGPLRDTETPVVRPYVLVEDIKASVASAAEAGAEIALPPMEIPEHGTCAIVIHSGIECGLWQV
jgi:predicted enzyme related to lactoylglutathione lyase